MIERRARSHDQVELTFRLPADHPADPVGVAGPADATTHLLTGSADRLGNMTAFAIAALGLLADQLAT